MLAFAFFGLARMRTLVALATCLTSTVGVSEEAATLRVVDLPRNGGQLLGRRVTVTDCAFAKATATHAICAPSSSANPGGPTLLLRTREMMLERQCEASRRPRRTANTKFANRPRGLRRRRSSGLRLRG